MARRPIPSHLPDRLIALTKDWALTVLYYNGVSLLATRRILRTMWEEAEPAVAVGIIVRQYYALGATSITLVVNVTRNEHSLSDFKTGVGEPLTCLRIPVNEFVLIHEGKIDRPEMSMRPMLKLRGGLVYPRTYSTD